METWRGASTPRDCEDPPRLHRTPVHKILRGTLSRATAGRSYAPMGGPRLVPVLLAAAIVRKFLTIESGGICPNVADQPPLRHGRPDHRVERALQGCAARNTRGGMVGGYRGPSSCVPERLRS
jgi:hypothetical protein